MAEGWTNPNDIMKSRRILRNPNRLSRSQSLNHTRRASHPLPKENLPAKTDSTIDSLKRHNPFSCQLPQAKQSVLKRGHSIDTAEVETKKLVSTDFFKEDHRSNVQQTQDDEDTVGRIGRNLKSMQDRFSHQKPRESMSAIDVLNTSEIRETRVLSNMDTADNSKMYFPRPVLDWSLKTKMRVVITQTKTNGNVKSIPGVDAKHLKAFAKSQYEIEDWQSLDVIHKIRRCSFHYSYPSMPWMSTFPRLKSYFKPRSSFLDTSDSTVLDSLQKDWSRVFTSVYQQLRGGSCPYFYVNTHQFTVLFRCLRSSSKCFLTALLSPSTRGFRELLKTEGISFQMPNLKTETTNNADKKSEKTENESSRNTQSVSRGERKTNDCETGYQSNDDDLFDDGGDDDDDDADNSGKIKPPSNDNDDEKNTSVDDETDDDNLASDWLEDMGLDKKDFPSLRPHNVKLQQENFREIDNRTQSMVYMQGLDVHAFFNFLVNYPGCIASSGPQYRIPPTILSPNPFLGGSLVENSVKQSVVGDNRTSYPNDSSSINESGDGLSLSRSSPTSKRHVLEISGPILPHHTLNISSIVQKYTSSSKLSYCLHPPTTAFNTTEKSEEILNILTTGLSKLLVPYSPEDLGLMKDVQDELLSNVNMSLKEARVQDHQFIID